MTASIDTIKAAISSGGGIAKSNNFLVELPNIGGSMRTMNILCNGVNMPGKQITTLDRRIGMEFEKIAYGYAVDDVNMSFNMPNSYLPKKYFDNWRSIIIDENRQVAAYKNSYSRSIKIHQLRNSLPSNAFNIQVGPVGIKVPGVNDILNTFASRKDINVSTSAYTVELIEAFPVQMSPIQFSNEADQMAQFNVSIAYTRWRRISSSQISFKL
tara:strand:- start:37 stop:675 length:639 start_codon:yes stop_codon:yes gene_type:complete